MTTPADAHRLTAAHGIPPAVAAALHAAGYREGSRSRGDWTADTRAATDALLAAVDALPRTDDRRIVGTLDSDPAPALPDLDPDTGLVVGTPAPPDALPVRRHLLWEWASTLTDPTLLAQLTTDPAANGWPAFPDPALTRDPYGVDPGPVAAYAVHAYTAARAMAAYVPAAEALDRLDALLADRDAPVDADTLTALTDRARTAHALPPGARLRRRVLSAASADWWADAVAAAIRTRTRWGTDGYPLATTDARGVDAAAYRRLADVLDRTLRQTTDDDVVADAAAAVGARP